MKYTFVHHYDPSADYGEGVVVALYPDVAYALDERGVSYQTLSAFYDEHEVFSGRGEPYFRQFLAWVELLDGFLREKIPACHEEGFSLCRTNLTELKYLIDELAIESWIVRSFLERAGQSVEIRYIRRPMAGTTSATPRNLLKSEASNFIFDLFKLAQKGGTGMTLNLSELTAEPAKASSKKPRRKTGLLFSLAKSVEEAGRYRKWRAAPGDRCVRRVLAFHAGNYQIDEVIRQLMRRGSEVFSFTAGRLCRVNDWLKLPSSKNGAGLISAAETEVFRKTAAALVTDERLFEWPEKLCGWPIRGILGPLLRNFVEQVCLETLGHARAMRAIMIDKKIDLLVANSSGGYDCRGALVAARSLGVPAICFQHGIHAYLDPSILMTDLDPFDAYFTTESFSEEKYRNASRRDYVSPCRVYQSSHYLTRVRDKWGWQRIKSASPKRRTIVYVPTKVVSYRRSLTVPTYPVDWYYAYQKKLVDYFASRKDVSFIFKQPKTDWKMAYRSILPYFENKRGYENIRVETDRLSRYFSEADGLIIDRPTTSAFESAAAGIPFVCLCADFVSYGIQDEFRRLFGKTFQVFEDPGEALHIVDRFLAADPKEYHSRLEFKPYDFDCVFSRLSESMKEVANG